MANILIVDDDFNTRRLIETTLKRTHKIYSATDGKEGVNLFEENHIDLLIIDVMMPEMDGFELTNILRKTNHFNPILMLTSRSGITDKSKGFNLGIDDYMTKPFDPLELKLRVDALLRRANINNQNILEVNGLIINKLTLEIKLENETICLPKKEFDLLFKLLSNPNIIYTKYQLMDEIWGITNESDDHTVNVHINRLRNKFSDNKKFQILTIRGLGFKAVVTNEK